jgi:hypothetical protein
MTIKPLVGIVREIDDAAADYVRTASILVSACADAETVVVEGQAFRLPSSPIR